MKDKRVAASNERNGPKAEITGDKAALVKKVHAALYDSYRSAYLPANLLQA